AIIGTDDFEVRARRGGDQSNIAWLRLPANSPLRIAFDKSPGGRFDAVSPIDHIRRSISYRTLPDYPLLVMVGFSNNEFLSAFRMRTLALLIAGIILTALII